MEHYSTGQWCLEAVPLRSDQDLRANPRNGISVFLTGEGNRSLTLPGRNTKVSCKPANRPSAETPSVRTFLSAFPASIMVRKISGKPPDLWHLLCQFDRKTGSCYISLDNIQRCQSPVTGHSLTGPETVISQIHCSVSINCVNLSETSMDGAAAHCGPNQIQRCSVKAHEATAHLAFYGTLFF